MEVFLRDFFVRQQITFQLVYKADTLHPVAIRQMIANTYLQETIVTIEKRKNNNFKIIVFTTPSEILSLRLIKFYVLYNFVRLPRSIAH